MILTFFYRFYPQLLRGGYIYRAELPLYGVTVGNKKYYAYDDEELAQMPKGVVERNKGLGQLESKDFRDTIFSKDGRYTQFTMEDGAQADYYFNMLMGSDVEIRRDYIYENVDWEEVVE